MPATLALVDRLRGEGLAAVVSGAGPSVLVLGDDGVEQAVRALTPADWTVLPSEVDVRGARVDRGDVEVSSR